MINNAYLILSVLLEYISLKINQVAGVTGLEPAAFGVTGRRSNQTELHPLNKFNNKYI